MFKEYGQYDATGLAELIARGEVSSTEVLDAALARATAVNPKINAIICPMTDIARARAKQALNGPFAGVPFLVKDLFQEYAGVPCAMGNKALKQAAIPAPEHAEITKRWLAAGVVIFGRTNAPEFGAKGITEPDAWGPTRNPWDLSRTPGGSSGGSAAAVAAGVVPMAGGNDGGGSIRIPSGCCGLFGLKPGRGRTPWGPRLGESMHGAAVNHVLSRSVRDSARMLDATRGPERTSFFHPAPPERPYVEELVHDPAPLRIGFSTRSPIGTEVDGEAVAAVQEAAKLLESLGHHVEEAEPSIYGPQIGEDFLRMWFPNVAATVAEVRAATHCGDAGFELDTLAMAAFGRAMSAQEYVEGYVRWNDYQRSLGEFHERYDFFLTPTLACAPAHIGEVATPAWQRALLRCLLASHTTRVMTHLGVVEQMARENLKWVPFTQLANLTGVPAMSVPLHWTASGVPLGVQFVGTHGSEGKLLCLAAQLERAQGWADRRPAW
ncbi:MAG TPA: amidase [Nevskiaceae bacterium]|nr:amidase [Nevskiaceae bacterium]